MPETRDSFSLNRSQLSQLWRIVCRADKSDQVQLLAEWEASWIKLASGKRLIDDLYKEYTI